MSAFSLAEHDGVATLRFDVAGAKVNLLDESTMGELDTRLQELARRSDLRALLIESGKPAAFIAGADVRAFASIADAAAAEAASRRGQEIFGRLEALPMPTVALIHGACVGGGLELALACRYRVASDDPATRLGLPEVQLGIVPGFGGTQRLPRTVGLPAALPLLLTGKRIPARIARRIGLVDEVAAPQRLHEAAARVLATRPHRGPPARAVRALERLLRAVPRLRRFVLDRARRSVRARTGATYPAPLRILDAVDAAYGRDRAAGFALEARLLGELLVGPESRNLVRLFLLAEAAPGDAADARSFERAFVAGAGQMGAGIAALLAGAGLRTRLHDAVPAALARGLERGRASLRRRFREDRDGLRHALDRLDPSIGLHGLERCELFLEAVIEDLDVKRRLLREAARPLAPGALLATNTRSLDLDEVGAALDDSRKELLVGLHFFHPVETMRLVEVVRGRVTASAAIARGCALARRLGKVPVVVASRPGFLVNRLLAPYLLEAERLVDEGVAIEPLDRAVRAAGMPMGPVELLDEVGLDVAARVGEVLRAAFPERAAAFRDPGVVRRLVASGALGRKSGRGFYVHGRRRSPNPQIAQGGPLPEDALDRLFLPVVAEAFRCLDEKVVATADELDLAMSLGAGFLVAAGGPLGYARRRGLAEVTAGLERLAARHGARFDVPAALRSAAA